MCVCLTHHGHTLMSRGVSGGSLFVVKAHTDIDFNSGAEFS